MKLFGAALITTAVLWTLDAYYNGSQYAFALTEIVRNIVTSVWR